MRDIWFETNMWHGIAAYGRSAPQSTCAGCKQSLSHGRFLTCLHQNWHPSCFCCRSCGKAIVDREVCSPDSTGLTSKFALSFNLRSRQLILFSILLQHSAMFFSFLKCSSLRCKACVWSLGRSIEATQIAALSVGGLSLYPWSFESNVNLPSAAQFSVQEDAPYHRECYKKSFHPKCEICYNFVSDKLTLLTESSMVLHVL